MFKMVADKHLFMWLQNMVKIETIEIEQIFWNSKFQTNFPLTIFLGHESVVSELLKNGAELNILNNDKLTAVEVAAQLGENQIS